MKTLFTLLVVLISLSNISSAQNCLIADFPFLGNVQDVSGNGNNGTIIGNPTLTTGHLNYPNSAYDFALGDGIDVNNTLGNFGTADFSISLWVKYTGLPFSHGRLFMKRFACVAAANSGPFYNLGVMDDGKVALETNDIAYASKLSTGEPIDDDNWHHLVLVRTGTDHKVYIDNMLNFNLVTPAINNYVNAATLQFGTDICIGVGSGVKFVGDLDNIKYFNCAIGTAKIDTLYNYDFPLSLKESFKSNFKVYPNPSNGEIILEKINAKGDVYTVEVMDLTGAQVFHQNVDAFPFTVNLANSLTGGLYFMKVTEVDKGLSFSRKIILK